MDHTSGSEMKEERSVIKESSRIAREAVQPITTLKASSDVAAVVFPGGFGAAKNLSNFGFMVCAAKSSFLFVGAKVSFYTRVPT